jgi:DNA polymerase-1
MSTERQKLMILDCNGLAHALKHSTKNLSYRGQRTGILFGFMRTLLKLQELLRADNWAFAWDSSKGYLRQKEYPLYKANRKAEKTEEEKKLDEISYPQFTRLRSYIIKELGFSNIFCFDGFESDDIMAEVIQTNYGKNYDCIIVTRDRDMYQCLSDRVSIFDPIKEQPYTVSDLRGQYGCEPEDWSVALSIAGCGTDNVKGVDGVGMKTAIKFIKGTLKETSKAFAAISSNSEIVEHNWSLVYLPHWRTPRTDLRLVNQPTKERMLEVATKHGMRSMTSVQFVSRWEEAFK